ncbi:MAG TPA: thermonuclease family protein [Planctomycetota bacterium]|nr:thermonuclease family protein [Planctomycetota bacterium]
MRPILAALIFLAGAGCGWLFARFGPQLSREEASPRGVNLSVQDGGVYRVRKVVDGDTIVLDNGLHVRYLGINTPESGHFVKDPAPLAVEATARNMELVEGRRVRIFLPKDPLDIHGRLVARVELVDDDRGSSPEAEPGRALLREGLARLMTLGVDHPEAAELKQLEADARARKAGIWGLEDKARAENADKPYIAATAGTVYHLRACSTAQRIKNANLHEYTTAEQAEHAGYKPCSKCVMKAP